jgi:hypothetical protein
VVEALEHLGVAAVLAADHGAAVGAGVVEHVHLAGLGAADHEHRAAADRTAHVVAGFGDLRLVPDVQPGVREDPVQLGLVDLR